MTFIRSKSNKGKPYLFAVKNMRQGKKVIQLQHYLGKAASIEVDQMILRGKVFDHSWFLLQAVKSTDLSSAKNFAQASMNLEKAKSIAQKLNHHIVQIINAAGHVERQTVDTKDFYKMILLAEELHFVAPSLRKSIVEFIEYVRSLLNKKDSFNSIFRF